MRVIGTAGHVDHGKSTLIEALTGTHPDRLKEEQERGMTIDLGFGWLTLPDGQEVGIVDVPGHRDFVENMLAGIAGIDAVLLVIAVDEGVMPQTTEHLAILDILRIPTGVIVMSKTDLAPDSEWLDAVESDIRSAVTGTVLQDAPIVRVSSRSRSGVDKVLSVLGEVLRKQPDRVDLGRPRLPIDRVFSMSGFGTVVTGTLSDGKLSIGDEVQFLPSGLVGRIRGLQTHHKAVELALPGSRTAANISGIASEQLQRGEVLTYPGQYEITRRIDARIRLLPNTSTNLRHNREVKIFLGTNDTTAILRILDAHELAPGQQGWIQLELLHPLVCVRGDPLVLRRPSPGETLGGGVVVEAHPESRHRRFDPKLLSSLNSIANGNPRDLMFEAALALHAAPIREYVLRSHLEDDIAIPVLHELFLSGKLVLLENGDPGIDRDLLAIALPDWIALKNQVSSLVSTYHKKHPLRVGIPREELKSQLQLAPRLFNAVIAKLASTGSLLEKGNFLARPEHTIRFDQTQQTAVDALLSKFEQNPFSPPSLKECRLETGEEIINALVTLGNLIFVSGDVVFQKSDYDTMVSKVVTHIKDKGQVTLAEVRDQFHTSRKYAQALLEHLDSIGVTKRTGDARVLAD